MIENLLKQAAGVKDTPADDLSGLSAYDGGTGRATHTGQATYLPTPGVKSFTRNITQVTLFTVSEDGEIQPTDEVFTLEDHFTPTDFVRGEDDDPFKVGEPVIAAYPDSVVVTMVPARVGTVRNNSIETEVFFDNNWGWFYAWEFNKLS